ncbi:MULTISPECIES: helix-turn-helix domain-containing protein [unclassified Pyramidobacter]|uniref:helix-turn-helix domain-containing protein n=1 Tax=unclassified Pyramidobacter TaxID=2632171 RepID=UPI00098F7238|nr:MULTISPECIES: RodZ domain-containing protein [unclassified Pyramidobacter]OON89845.1 hypothetical protein B0D78_01770 [Pyramidobacter sp. C12-8]RKJ77375.1 DUF4115 domain-containing protein [Pyramidobacter sp. CG50-2]WOL40254.1 DUF4115 domain-containing protein [Pyramidobacter sp. YE332]
MKDANTPTSERRKDEPRSLQELGAELQRLRESKNLTLDDISAATCIRKNFLEDIEAGNFARFKALVYARGFVRTCTTLLGAPELWNEYRQQLTIDTFGPAQGASESADRSESAGRRHSMMPPSSVRAGAANMGLPARGFRHSSTRRNGVILLVLLIVGALGGLWFNWDRLRGEVSKLQREQAYDEMKSREAEQARHDEMRKAEEAAVQREMQARRQAENAGAEPDAEPPLVPAEKPAVMPEKTGEAAAKAALTIRASGDCWLRVREGDKDLLVTTVREGFEQTFPLDRTLSVRFGAGQNVQVSTNGTDFSSPGGGVQRLEYRPDGSSLKVRR